MKFKEEIFDPPRQPLEDKLAYLAYPFAPFWVHTTLTTRYSKLRTATKVICFVKCPRSRDLKFFTTLYPPLDQCTGAIKLPHWLIQVAIIDSLLLKDGGMDPGWVNCHSQRCDVHRRWRCIGTSRIGRPRRSNCADGRWDEISQPKLFKEDLMYWKMCYGCGIITQDAWCMICFASK
jgi:hypothetical protein